MHSLRNQVCSSAVNRDDILKVLWSVFVNKQNFCLHSLCVSLRPDGWVDCFSVLIKHFKNLFLFFLEYSTLFRSICSKLAVIVFTGFVYALLCYLRQLSITRIVWNHLRECGLHRPHAFSCLCMIKTKLLKTLLRGATSFQKLPFRYHSVVMDCSIFKGEFILLVANLCGIQTYFTPPPNAGEKKLLKVTDVQ